VRLKFWRYGIRHSPVADSLEEAGDRLFTFTRLPASQWKSARTTNAIERLHEEFKQRIKTQTVLPSSDTAAMFLGTACFQPGHYAQDRRMANTGNATFH
jgi:putative transposase